jgi:hypothetical protein
MNLLKEIVEKLECLPESDLQEVLDFVDFLVTRKAHPSTRELWEQQHIESKDNCPVEWIMGVLVVQGKGQGNWETAVHELREERIKKLTLE